MTVSGTNAFSVTRNHIINRVAFILGVKTKGRSLTAEEITDLSDALNVFVKGLKGEGDYLWKYAEGTLFLDVGQESYKLDGSTANATESFTQTKTSSAASSGSSSIPVINASGFVIGYNIGIMQANGNIHWTTISNVSGTTITLTSSLASNVSNGAAVYVYQTKINRPLKITSVRRRDSSGYDTPVNEYARSDYFNLAQKGIQGQVTGYYYDPQLTEAKIYLYNSPSDASNTIKFTFQKMFFDFNNGNDEMDFPIEWSETIIFGLASRLVYEYRVDKIKAEQIKRTADEMLRNLKGYDREGSIYIVPTYNLYK